MQQRETILRSSKTGLWSRIRQSFVAGLVVILPVFITFLLLRIVIGYLREGLHSTFHALIELVLGPWLADSGFYDLVENVVLFAIGLPIVLLFILLIGWLTRNYVGRKIIEAGEWVLEHIPLVGGIYDSLKKLVQTIFMSGGKAYRSVVMVEYPRRGTWVLGFVTSTSEGEVQARTGGKVVGIFIPTTPNPTSGFLIYVPEQQLVHMDMSVEDGVKLVISGGAVEPPYAPLQQGDPGGEDARVTDT